MVRTKLTAKRLTVPRAVLIATAAAAAAAAKENPYQKFKIKTLLPEQKTIEIKKKR